MNNQFNLEEAESINFNVMSTNRTLNSQKLSKNNLVINSLNTLNVHSKQISNLINSQSLNKDYNTFSQGMKRKKLCRQLIILIKITITIQ